VLAGYNAAPFNQNPQMRVLYTINPRYNHQEAWDWIRELLETEAHTVELNDVWENALGDVCKVEPTWDNGWEE
jgi:hypothetical protein